MTDGWRHLLAHPMISFVFLLSNQVIVVYYLQKTKMCVLTLVTFTMVNLLGAYGEQWPLVVGKDRATNLSHNQIFQNWAVGTVNCLIHRVIVRNIVDIWTRCVTSLIFAKQHAPQHYNMYYTYAHLHPQSTLSHHPHAEQSGFRCLLFNRLWDALRLFHGVLQLDTCDCRQWFLLSDADIQDCWCCSNVSKANSLIYSHTRTFAQTLHTILIDVNELCIFLFTQTIVARISNQFPM